MTLQNNTSQGSKVVKAAGIVLIMNLLSRVLGFVRDAVIAREFGASGATDAYLVAYTLPYALQAVLGMAFVAVVVPIITSYLIKGDKEEAFRATSILFNWTIIALAAVSVLGIFVAPLLIKLLAPGFEQETYSLTVSLTRIIFPSIIFMGAGMLVTGVLNANNSFAIPAFAPAFANIIVISSVLFFAGYYRIHGLAVGTLVSFVGFLLIQMPSLKKMGFKWKWEWDKNHPALKKAQSTVMPITFAIGINQVYLAVNRIFASGLEPGSITAIDFAYRLMALPLGIFVAAIVTAIFPVFARHAVENDLDSFSQALVSGMALVSLVAIPSAVGLMVVREPLIQIVFERGAFDAYATQRTAAALLYFSLGLWAVGANTVVTRAYFAIDNVKIPLLVGLVCAVLNIGFSLGLMPFFSHAGLALANSLSAVVNILLLLIVFAKLLPKLDILGLIIPFLKALGAATGMGLILTLINPYLINLGMAFDSRVLGLMIHLLVIVLLGAIIYLGLLLIFRTKELDLIKKLLKRS